MAKKHLTPHDRLFRNTFSYRSEVLLFIKNFCPKSIYGHLDFRTLKIQNTSFVNEKLENSYSDINYTCKWRGSNREVLLSFLFEHKSYPVKFAEMQLLRYLLEGYEYQLKQGGPYSLIVPILLYHGKEKFNKTTFFENLELSDSDFGRYFPGFEFIKVDLSRYSDEELTAIGDSFLSALLLLFKHKKETEFILTNYQKIFIFVKGYKSKSATERFVETLVLYIYQTFTINQEEITGIVNDLPKNVSDMFVSTYDLAVQSGEKKGIEKGIKKGELIGIEKGKTLGSFEVAFELFVTSPELDAQNMSKISKLEKKTVAQLQACFRKNDVEKAKKLIARALEAVSPVSEMDSKNIDELVAAVFKK